MPHRVIGFFFADSALFLRYVSVGALSALIELCLFSLAYQYFHWPLLIANSGALALAVAVNFVAQRSWTFRNQSQVVRQMRLYLLMQGLSALLNNLLVYLLIARWGLFPPMAKLIQMGLVFIWNFSFCKLVVFARRTAASGSQV